VRVFLETQRLVLRRFSTADVDNLVQLDADPDVMRLSTEGSPRPGMRSRMTSSPHSWPITTGMRASGSGR